MAWSANGSDGNASLRFRVQTPVPFFPHATLVLFLTPSTTRAEAEALATELNVRTAGYSVEPD
jgi:hypothetical protein